MTDFCDKLVLYVPELRRFSRRLMKDSARADDLLHDTLLKAIECQERYTRDTNMRAWLFAILRNTFLSQCRRTLHDRKTPGSALPEIPTQQPAHDLRLAYRDFMRAFTQLSNNHRQALFLVGATGMTYCEAAQSCNVAVGTMKSRTSRARKELAHLMHLA